MSFTPFHFSPQSPSLHLLDREESGVAVRRRSWEQPGLEGGGMDPQPHAVEFWPLQHPMEPRDEDRPVKCPMFASSSSSSSSIDDGKGHDYEQRVAAETSRKRLEQPAMEMTAEPPVRAVRKRHHTLTHDVHVTAEPQPPLPPISQMLKQFDHV